jgi:bifunctional non-homologous end joining protein LigD
LNTDQRWFTIDGSKSDGLYLATRPGKHGFDNDIAQELQARLKPLVRKTRPYSKRIFLAKIEYRAKSAEGKVRHPVFKGLRDRPVLGR